jgi:hypothetical protein
MALTAKQLKAIEMMVYDDKKDIEIYTELGMSSATFWKWKKNQEFQDAVSAECKRKFRSLEQLAIKKLQENVANNNQKAIEYALDFLGYKATEQHDIDMTAHIEVDYGDDE